MATFNASQFRSQISRVQSQLRQAEGKARQAVRDIDRATSQYQHDVDRAVTRYNSGVRAYNAQVRQNQTRLQQAVRQLQTRPTSATRFVTYQTSVQTVQQSFVRLESVSRSSVWTDRRNHLDLAEGETAASVEALDALLAERTAEAADDEARLRNTTITSELTDFGGDLNARWKGALFALSPRNPDAGRQFSASTRELLVEIVDHCASDTDVLAQNPDAPLTPQGSVSRRARIQYRLEQLGDAPTEFAEFIEADVGNVITLLKDMNAGTHGEVITFDFAELSTVKTRAEQAIKFLHKVLV